MSTGYFSTNIPFFPAFGGEKKTWKRLSKEVLLQDNRYTPALQRKSPGFSDVLYISCSKLTSSVRRPAPTIGANFEVIQQPVMKWVIPDSKHLPVFFLKKKQSFKVPSLAFNPCPPPRLKHWHWMQSACLSLNLFLLCLPVVINFVLICICFFVLQSQPHLLFYYWNRLSYLQIQTCRDFQNRRVELFLIEQPHISKCKLKSSTGAIWY